MVKLPTILWLLAAATASTEAWECWEEDNTAYYGNNIPGGMSYQPSQSACQRACSEHAGCSYWTWSRGGKCYLKTSDDGRETTSYYVSGTKDCKGPEGKGKSI